MTVNNKFKSGQLMYYPSIKGMALLCEVLDESEKDVLVRIEGKKFYLPKESVNNHAILLDETRSKIFVSQRIEDPDNQIVYLRYNYNDSILDKLYNWYCSKFKKDPNTRTIIQRDEFTGDEPSNGL